MPRTCLLDVVSERKLKQIPFLFTTVVVKVLVGELDSRRLLVMFFLAIYHLYRPKKVWIMSSFDYFDALKDRLQFHKILIACFLKQNETFTLLVYCMQIIYLHAQIL